MSRQQSFALQGLGHFFAGCPAPFGGFEHKLLSVSFLAMFEG